MKPLFIVTTNAHKVKEIRAILSENKIKIIQKKLEIVEPDYDTLEEVAIAKATQAFEKIKKPLIVEDTGVFFEGYNKFPGQIAKRVYLGIGFSGLLSLIRATKNKKAHFKTVICFVAAKNSFKLFSGTLNGRLIEKVVNKEKNRLPYEKIFIPKGHSKTLVELDLNEKNKISHRAKATRKLGKWLEENY